MLRFRLFLQESGGKYLAKVAKIRDPFKRGQAKVLHSSSLIRSSRKFNTSLRDTDRAGNLVQAYKNIKGSSDTRLYMGRRMKARMRGV